MPSDAPRHAESGPPYTVSRTVVLEFRHDCTITENLDAAGDLVSSQIRLALNKAAAECLPHGIKMQVVMGVDY